MYKTEIIKRKRKQEKNRCRERMTNRKERERDEIGMKGEKKKDNLNEI